MAQRTFDPVYWLVVDLAKSDSLHLSSYVASRMGLASLKHWAIRIRDQCYEVTSYPTRTTPKLYKLSATEWESNCRDKRVTWKVYQVGVTCQPDGTISFQADQIWTCRFREKYKLPISNCQNFAHLLFRAIAWNAKEIGEDTKRNWKAMPPPITDSIALAKVQLLIALIPMGIFPVCVLGCFGGCAACVLGAIVSHSVLGYLCLLQTRDKRYLRHLKKYGRSCLNSFIKTAEGAEAVDGEQERVLRGPDAMIGTDLESDYSHDQMQATSPATIIFQEALYPDNPSSSQARYKNTVDGYVEMGFSVEHVIAALNQWGIDPSNGQCLRFNTVAHETIVQTLLESY